MPIAKNRLGISEIRQKKSRGHSSGPAKRLDIKLRSRGGFGTQQFHHGIQRWLILEV